MHEYLRACVRACDLHVICVMMHTRTGPPKHLSTMLVSLPSVRACVWVCARLPFLRHLPLFLCPVSPPPFPHITDEGGETATLTLQQTYPELIPPQNRSMDAAEAERYMHVCKDDFVPRNATEREMSLRVRELGGSGSRSMI